MRRQNIKSSRQVSRRETDTDNIPSHVPASMENIPDFLIQAKDALEAGNIEQTRELLCEEAVRQIDEMPQGPPKILAIYMLASQFMKIAEYDKAEKWYKDLLQYGQFSFAYFDLSQIHQEKDHLVQAVEYGRKALELEPDSPKFLCTLGVELSAISRVDEGYELMKKALEKDPENIQIGRWSLVVMHYKSDITPQMLYDEHTKWARQFAPVSMIQYDHDNLPDPDKKIRVGYISPNFCRHSIAYFLEPIINNHDHNLFELYAYNNTKKSDQFTEKFKNQFDHFKDIRGVSHADVADLIKDDKIDILVDLAGHTKNNSILVLARKPAPIQVTYLGYPDTTGLEQIDYRITDVLADPPSLNKYYSEELVYLPDNFICYRPPEFSPPLAPSPHIKNGYITFGSFNMGAKISPMLIIIWAQVLNANENSHLLLKFRGGQHQQVQDYYRNEFSKYGIAPDRIQVHGRKSPIEHLQMYGKVDIALDTYPYNGTTTTCEAMWMGVPVISLVGEHHSCRVALSIFKSLDMDFFIATTPDEYISKATALAAKPEALAKIRSSMRARMAASTLCDGKLFTNNIEDAYKKMWHKWCQSMTIKV